jgi:Arc/MetJ family transcription regulator
MNLKQEIRQTIINNRIIAKKIYRMHQEGKTVNQIYKALFEFDFVAELELQSHLTAEFTKYKKWLEANKTA